MTFSASYITHFSNKQQRNCGAASVKTPLARGGTIAFMLLPLAACGGGGGSAAPTSPATTPPPPEPDFTEDPANTYTARDDNNRTLDQAAATADLTVAGKGGNDTITTGSGADNIHGGDGKDRINGGAGDDLINGGDGDDRLFGGPGRDILNGGAGASDKLYLNYNDNDLEDDSFDGGTGHSDYLKIVGNDGQSFTIDLLDVTAKNIESISLSTGNQTLTFDANDIHRISENGRINFYGNGGDSLTLEWEDWELIETVSLLNDGGYMTFQSDEAVIDVNLELFLNDFNEFHADFNEGSVLEFVAVDNESSVFYMPQATENLRVISQSGNDFIIAGEGSDTVFGGAGHDHIMGRNGDDKIDGGDGDDTISGGGGHDTINGNQGDDWLAGGSGDDSLNGGKGNDFLNGGRGDDILDGGEGDDWIIGSGKDIMYGGDGNDALFGSYHLYGGGGQDYLYSLDGPGILDGGAGIDTLGYLYSTAGVIINLADNSASGGYAEGDVILNFENVEGSQFDDTITGDSGENTLKGLNGDDFISGGDGADTLIGGAGNDTLIYTVEDTYDGGNDKDVLQLDSADLSLDLSQVTISNMEVIDLTGTGDNAVHLTLQDLLEATDADNELIIAGDAGDSIVSLDQGWVQGDDLVIDGESFHSYISGAGTLLVDVDITQNIS